MILDTLNHIGKYAGLGPAFAAAAAWLQSADLQTLEPGRIGIDGDRVYATLADNRLEPKDPSFEVHRSYADIQLVLRGRERLFYGREGRELSGRPENDVWFCEADRHVPFVLEAGQFAVFLPGEAHAPGLPAEADAGTVPVTRKMVVKVRMD